MPGGSFRANPDWVFDRMVPEVLERLQRSYPDVPLPQSPVQLDSVELGCGTLGCAYDLGDDVVFKLTTSENEVGWARAQLTAQAEGSREATVGMAYVYAATEVPAPRSTGGVAGGPTSPRSGARRRATWTSWAPFPWGSW